MSSGSTTFFFLVLFYFCTIILCTCNTTRAKLASPKFPAILVFGDSTVDSGNNNYINTLFKGNHYPYGKDFPGHIPTGRFSNGKLVPDFIASMLRIKDTVPPFLNPILSDKDILTGVSFASAGSGYDELTTVASGVIPVMKQVQYFKEYLTRLGNIVGEKKAKQIINEALVIVSAGTNDFGFNFYDIPTRKIEFNISGYQDFLQNRLETFVKELYDHGCRKIAISGLPPIGCLPIQITLNYEIAEDRRCVEEENSDSEMYNYKLEKRLLKIQAVLPGTKIVFADIYKPLMDMINRPEKFGFLETKRGCCGTGILEVGPVCNLLTPTCDDASEYLFWDSIHPSEATYQYLAKYLEKEVLPKLHNIVHRPPQPHIMI